LSGAEGWKKGGKNLSDGEGGKDNSNCRGPQRVHPMLMSSLRGGEKPPKGASLPHETTKTKLKPPENVRGVGQWSTKGTPTEIKA